MNEFEKEIIEKGKKSWELSSHIVPDTTPKSYFLIGYLTAYLDAMSDFQNANKECEDCLSGRDEYDEDWMCPNCRNK